MCVLHSAYLGLSERFISDIEKNDPHKKRENDIREAEGVIRLYLSGLALTVKSLKSGDFEKFDAVVGDHNCHISARIALAAVRELSDEMGAIESKLKPIHIKSTAFKSPRELIEEAKCPFTVSETMKYLACCAILRSGTECIEHSDGSMTLTINPQNIIGKCDREIVKRLITPLREYINQFSIAYIQRIANRVFAIHVVTTCRGERYQFIIAFDNMKTTLLSMAQDGVYFLVVPYERNKKISGELHLFDPSGQRVDPTLVDPKTPIFVIQGFGNLDAVHNPIEFTLDSIAVVPQLETEDGELSEEVVARREKGKLCVEQFRIVHTYADTLGRIKKV